jgi:uncharacterized protein involved in exopolysaccharide biosynthesis
LQGELADTKPNTPIVGNAGTILEPEDRLVALQSQLTSLVGTYSEEHPDIKRLRREIANLRAETGLQADVADRQAKLSELEAQLSVLRQKYADDHPDIVRLKRTYATIEGALKADAEASGVGSGEAHRPRKPDNPAYINLKTQIESTAAQIESMRAERKAMRARLAELDARVGEAPEVERQYLELARDMDTSRARFRELREKQMQAQVAEQLERDRKAERFTLIDPPVFPEKPYRPNRSAIMLIGLLLALGGGVGAAALREALDASVHGVRDVVRVLQVPVLAVIPMLPSPTLRRRRSMHLRIVMAVGLLLLVAGLVLFHYLYMPLDVAWYSILRRIAN